MAALNMKTNLRELTGNWDRGYALDKHTLHSEYLGENEFGHPQFNTTRSEAGEALYQLKYRSDFSQVAALAQAIVDDSIPRLGKIGLVVPMPPSKARAKQPVAELAKAIAKALEVPYFDDILVKTSLNPQSELKNLSSKDEKLESLKSRFELNQAITNEGRWNALVVDDLFDTGASMEAACEVLRQYKKIGKIFVAAVTWK